MQQNSSIILEKANRKTSVSKLSSSFSIVFLTLIVVTVWALFTGYTSLFGFIAPHDDEGYVMITVKQFLDGRVLYDEIFSQYGPGYYLYKWLFFNSTGLPVTHDVSRLTALGVWTLTGLVCAVFGFRLTRSAIAAAAVYVLTFLGLYRTIYEPEHPQSLCALLVALGLLVLSFQDKKRIFEILIGLTGAILAFLFFAKVNIGIFFGLALAIIFVAYFQPSKWQRVILWLLIFGAMMMSFVLFRKHLFIGWIYRSLTVMFSLFAAFLFVKRKDYEFEFTLKHALIFSATFTAASLVIIFFVLAKGTSTDALLNALIFQNLKFGEAFYSLPLINFASVIVGFLGLAGAFAYKFFSEKILPARLNLVLAAAKFLFGATLVLVSLFSGKDRRYHILINFGISFLWLTLIPPFESHEKNFLMMRSALVFTAILLVLQVYPIPGSQISFGSFAILIAAVLCLNDAASFWGESEFVQRKNFPVGKLAAAFSVLIISAVCIYPALIFYRTFQSQVPLELPGAERFRLPEKDVAMEQFLVRNLNASCEAFVSMPGKSSYFFWTRKEPPTTFNTTAWMTLLDERQQQFIVDKLNASARPCAVYYPYLAAAGLRGGQTLDSFVLSKYILQNFHSLGEAGEHQFLVPQTSSQKLIYYARFIKTDSVSGEYFDLIFSRPGNLEISAIQIYDLQTNRIIADSAHNSILNENTQPLTLPLGKNDSTYSSEKMKFISAADLEDKNLILRLFDANGNRIATIPFVEGF